MDEESAAILENARFIRRSHSLALGLSRSVNARIMLVIDDMRPIHNLYTRDVIPFVSAVFAVLPDDTLVDDSGFHERRTIEARFLARNEKSSSFRFIEVSDEASLAQFVSTDWDYVLSPIPEAEIEASMQHYQRATFLDADACATVSLVAK